MKLSKDLREFVELLNFRMIAEAWQTRVETPQDVADAKRLG
jgi:hypothetical protein